PTALYTLYLHDALPIWDFHRVEVHFIQPVAVQCRQRRYRHAGRALVADEEAEAATPAVLASSAREHPKIVHILRVRLPALLAIEDRKSTRLNSSHVKIS